MIISPSTFREHKENTQNKNLSTPELWQETQQHEGESKTFSRGRGPAEGKFMAVRAGEAP